MCQTRGQVLLKDFDAQIASELVDQSLLETLTFGANVDVDWRCEKGHVYKAKVSARTASRGGTGCPYCSGKKVLVGFNDALSSHPEAVKKAVHPEQLLEYTAKSNKKIEWKCEHGHVWEAPIINVLEKGTGCPYCSGKKILVGETDLKTTHPEVAALLEDQSLATQLQAGSSKRVNWICSEGHTWSDMVRTQVSHGSECPVCAGRRSSSGGAKTIATERPDLVDQLVDKANANLSFSSHKKVEWKCDEGHVWEAEVAARVRLDSGCPYCSGRLAIVGVNDLSTTHPDLVKELVNPEEGKTVTSQSAKRLEWQCQNCEDHRWVTEVRNRVGSATHHPSGCPICANTDSLHPYSNGKVKDVCPEVLCDAVNPELVGELTTGSGKKVEWYCHECSVEHTYTASVRKHIDGQRCPVKAGRQIMVGVNDLWTTHPELAKELVDSDVGYEVTHGTPRQVKWCCENGHEWMASVYSRVMGNGCPQCACNSTSNMEIALADAVAMMVGEENILRNDRTVLRGFGKSNRPLELDILLPNHGLAIEFNGLIYHSVEFGKDPQYHKRKYELAKNMGYQLIQIWEDDWVYRHDAVLRALATKIGCVDQLHKVLNNYESAMIDKVGARQCKAQLISSAAAQEFLEKNHIQGAVSAKNNFGLVDPHGILRAVLSVRSPRENLHSYKNTGGWDIQRYATYGIVPGGFTKLLKFAEQYLLDSGEHLTLWVSYSANDVSDGSMYAKCGFALASVSAPEYRYAGRLTDNRRISKEAFQKRKVRKSKKYKYEEGLTEIELAHLNNLYRVYDSGKLKWVKYV